MVTVRRGAGSLGCLMSLLMISAIVYFGVNIGEVYWRYFEFKDEMNQQVRFAAHNQNVQIARTLRAVADSLDLPESAGNVYIRRRGHTISIESDYYERVELPLVVRDVHFNPHAEGTF